MVVDKFDHLSEHVQSDDQRNPLLGCQSSIFSLTLDEFQNTLLEGKDFGSMDMDEFLNSIWNAEEAEMQEDGHAQTQTQTQPQTQTHSLSATTYETMTDSTNFLSAGDCISITNHSSLPRQNPRTIPEPICAKTVQEVWFEIQKKEQNEQHPSCTSKIVKNPVSVPAQRQPTIDEMTLEDFFVEAGVIPEPWPILPLKQQGLYPSGNNPLVGPEPPRPILAYPPPATQFTPLVVGSAYAGGGYGAVEGLAPPAGLTMPTGGGYVIVVGLAPPTGLAAPPVGLAPPTGPIYSEGMIGNPVNGLNQAGLETSEARGSKKRSFEGVSDKVAERKRRRKIKNRESAARSRARKQAHTAEVVTAINKLKDENDALKQKKNTVLREMQELFKAEQGRKRLDEMRKCKSYILV